MNKGIAKATGDVIGILNADDVYENQYYIIDCRALRWGFNCLWRH